MDLSKYLAGARLDPKTGALYLQISELISGKILNNALPAGTKLPPERELASLFGVSRTTAINAYRHLEQQGMVKTRVGSGTYVAEIFPGTPGQSPGIPWPQLFTPYAQTSFTSTLRELVSNPISSNNISLATGMPDPAFYPVDQLQSLLNDFLHRTDRADFGYIPTEGYTPLRQSLVPYLTKKGINASLENLTVLSGAQQGLYLICKILLSPGDFVVVESPTYLGAIQLFQAAGARLLTLPVSGTFPLSLLEDYLIRYRPKLLYTIPTFHNPTGRLLPENQRKELLQLASRHRMVVLEDDPYSELFYGEPSPPSLKALDPNGGVIYLGTFSKILLPGLRTGFLVAHPSLVNRLAIEKQYNDLHSNNLSQWLVHLLLEEGLLDNHLKFVRREYKKRRDALARAIRRYCGEHLQFDLPEGGFYIWCKLNADVPSSKLLHESIKAGVSFVPGEAFHATPTEGREFRLCFATHPEALLTEGVRRLSKSLDQLSKNGRNRTTPTASYRPII
ncbi:PLP-dependent aminotransferase family protein [Desulforamulus ruminis]|uniref:Regulatory protein GntR HTH n=1 Tax=Desulforamulus ruminis (strain ATCC 23193 / DSM 2154 / NCIMB 8452 / DL) TaxID=696281 RepID=F6DSN5_DESRL|nr:PLP-dependent aminotransferase family protein [Desulforamulus ruminis]AEG58854.1 regulatory protein GntR HTH [Desulforamulus ruminis DSM 2154]